MTTFLSERGSVLATEPERVGFARHFRALDDLYEPSRNASGFINMGASETHLVDDQLISILQESWSRTRLSAADLHYAPDHGSRAFRSAIATHWQDVVFQSDRTRRLDAQNIVITTGATVALDMLATVLGDPGDVFLIPAPMYASFEFDIGRRAKVVAEPVHAGRQLDVPAFQSKLDAARSDGKKVRAVLLSSPNNPVGTVYSESSLRKLISFCIQNQLSIISDEIYGETVFDSEVTWRSIHDLVPDDYRGHTYSVSGFAKDFGLSGFKVGFVVSFNRDATRALQNIAYFSPVSTLTQFVLTSLLESDGRLSLLRANRETLKHAHAYTVNALRKIHVECEPASAGAFVMADFGAFLRERTQAEELRLIERLHDEQKVNVAPGCAYAYDVPGWVRICYAQSEATIDELVRRISRIKSP